MSDANPLSTAAALRQSVRASDRIALLFVPITKERRRSGKLGIVGSQHAVFARRAEGLGRIEAEASDLPDATRAPAAIFGAMGLGRVLDHDELVAPREARWSALVRS